MTETENETNDRDVPQRFSSLRHLSDRPSISDEFKGLSHQRTAQALVRTILEDKSGIRSIGLEGGWGSGKSSVVEIARSELESSISDIKTYVFTFDAWAHQGDPLRRAFLSEFVLWLHDNAIVKTDQKDKWMESIQAKVTQTITYTEPTFKVLGMLIIGLAPFLPLIYAWLSPFGFSKSLNIENITGLSASFLQVIAFILLLLPYVFVFLNWIFSPHSISKAMMVFSKTSDIDKTKQIIRDEDPTSVEFSKFLSEIISSINSDRRKILVVIDNIDRLPSEQMLEAWATMRTLVGKDGGLIGAGSSQNIWLIVPYDRHEVANSLKIKSDDRDLNQASSFIEKTFGLILRVPPPIITHWRHYFFDQLEAAFGKDLFDDEKHALQRCLEYDFLKRSRVITPRSIKAFINEVVSFVMQWGEVIPIQCIGFYVLNRIDLDQDSQQLKTGDIASRKHLVLFGDVEWQKYVTSLHFNVPPEDAYDVLIGQDIDRALEDGNIEGLRTLSVNPGFDLVLGDLVGDKAQDWAIEDADGFARRCQALAAIQKNGASYDQTWRSLGAGAQYLTDFINLEGDVSEGLVSLLMALDETDAESTAGFLKRRLCDKATNYDHFNGGVVWLQAMENLARAAKKILPKANVFEKFTVPGDAEFTAGVLFSVQSSKFIKLENLVFSVKKDKMTNLITNVISSTDIDQWIIAVFKCFSSEPNIVSLDKIVPDLQNLLTLKPDTQQSSDTQIRIRCLLELPAQITQKAIENLSNNHALLAHFGHAYGTTNDNPVIGMTLWALSRAAGVAVPANPGQHPEFGDLSTSVDSFKACQSGDLVNEEVLTAFVEMAENDQSFETLIDLSLKYKKNNSLYSNALNQFVDRGNIKRINTKNVIKKFFIISTYLSEENLAKFTYELQGWSEFVKPEYVKLFSRVFLESVHRTKSTNLFFIFTYTKDWLSKEFSEEDWKEEFQNEGHALSLLFGMITTVGIKLPTAVFRSALRDYSYSIFKGENYPESYEEEWGLLTEAMQKQSEKAFYQDLINWFDNNSTKINHVKALLYLYPNSIERIDIGKNADVIVSKILGVLVGDNSAEALSSVEMYILIFKKGFSLASQSSKELLTEIVDGVVSSQDAEAVEKLIDVAEQIGLSMEHSSIQSLGRENGDES